MKTEEKILIVGAGLAGICLARQLEKRNKTFTIIDSGINESSVIAAGQINPLVFRRMTKSWRIDEFLPYSKQFFKELAEEWNDEFYIEIPIRRSFSHDQERDLWLKKQAQDTYAPYMKILDEEDASRSDIYNEYGTGKVLQSAFVRSKEFVKTAHTWLTEKHCLQNTTFDFTLFDPSNGTYDGTQYSKVIFCEGYRGVNNPYFSYLPLETTKGEVLTVHSHEIPTDEAYNRKCFIIPIGDDLYKVGATYAWKTNNTDLTNEAKEELIEKAKQLTPYSFEVVNHEAGIRPTVLDRRPLMGKHPSFNNLFIFNGLGTKGYLLAPLLAEEFADYLLENKPLQSECSITRFNKKA